MASAVQKDRDFDDEFPGAEVFLPERHTLTALRAAARNCRGCPLYRRATQTVFGEGRAASQLMLVGEMPGNDEDLAGHPFVGPAGRLLDRALEEADIEKGMIYITNVVKHFKWEPRGKRRLHKKPGRREINACLPWLTAEIKRIKPRVLVALGATAAQALLGPHFRLTRSRGEFVDSELAPFVTATIHPSAILRQRTDNERTAEMKRLIADLRIVRRALQDAD